jgi:hypothetical protein
MLSWNVNPHITLWVISFLTERNQCVRYRNSVSSKIATSTGAPQGCVLSPVLFTLYTSECRTVAPETRLIKYADDTVLVGLLTKGKSEDSYRTSIDNFVTWCDEHKLLLNVKKTKELIMDFGIVNKAPSNPIVIKNEPVEIVPKYKYLGSMVDNNMKWSDNVHYISGKASKRIWFLRKLKQCNVDNVLLKLFYESTILSVLSFSVITWYSSASSKTIAELSRIEKTARKMINRDDVKSLNDIFQCSLKSKIHGVIHNPNHPLVNEYKLLRSGTRLMNKKCRTVRYRNSFIPNSLVTFNGLNIDSRIAMLNNSVL